jgi:hypothetical protein
MTHPPAGLLMTQPGKKNFGGLFDESHLYLIPTSSTPFSCLLLAPSFPLSHLYWSLHPCLTESLQKSAACLIKHSDQPSFGQKLGQKL